MKKFLVITAAFLLACVTFAQDANRMSYVTVLQPSAVDGDGIVQDIAAYKGNATFVVTFGAGAAAYTNTVTLSHATTSGGTYKTITNIVGTVAAITTTIGTNENTIVTYPCDLGRLSKYVKATVSRNANTNTASATSVILVAPMKSN